MLFAGFPGGALDTFLQDFWCEVKFKRAMQCPEGGYCLATSQSKQVVQSGTALRAAILLGLFVIRSETYEKSSEFQYENACPGCKSLRVKKHGTECRATLGFSTKAMGICYGPEHDA